MKTQSLLRYDRVICYVVAWTMAAMLALVPGVALSQDAGIPAFTGWVTDTTATLDPATKAQLSQKLAALDAEKGAQIAVLMIPTTGNEPIESYAMRAFTQWQLGRKDIDDGVLMLVAKDDRRIRIEVGYGLEGAIPDVLAGRIIREQITPHFSQGQFAQGVIAGVDSLVALVQGESLPEPVATSDADDAPWPILFALAFMAFMMPLGVPTLMLGVFAGIAFNSVVVGILTVMGATVIGVVTRLLGLGNTRQSVAASRRGGGHLGRHGPGGFGGGFGGGGFGGGGGGFGGGGGGRGGGGGASGSW